MIGASSSYRALRESAPLHVQVRGSRHHVWLWGDPAQASVARPPLVMLHGYMDIGASFQFVVDALARLEGEHRCIVAPDLRGFGLTESPPADAYWFPDYMGDLDGLLDALFGSMPVDLLGHSMGGNVVMMYAGVRPERVHRLINLEGFGLPETQPDEAPARFAQWLDELKRPQRLRDYANLDEVAAQLQKTNPRLPVDKARFLAERWAAPRDGRLHLRADPGHKRVNAMLYRKAEAVACWAGITAPLLWVEGSRTEPERWWGDRYSRAEFQERLAVVADVQQQVLQDAGHMLHHDQPEALAQALLPFLGA